MSCAILGLSLCLFVTSGLSQADNTRPGRSKLTSYCLSLGGKCRQRCDSRSESDVEKLEPFCGAGLRCCVGRPMARPQDAPGKFSGFAGAFTTSVQPASAQTLTANITQQPPPARRQVSPGLATISGATRSLTFPPATPRMTRLQPSLPATPSNTRLQPSPPATPSNTRLQPSPPTTSSNTRLQPSPPATPSNTRLQPSPPTTPSTTRLQPFPPATFNTSQSTPTPPLPGSGMNLFLQKVETKADSSFLSYKRYRKTKSKKVYMAEKGCGVPVLDRVRRIVGGSLAERCTFPWMVYIARDPGKDDLCGGTLVSDRHVITAAHCYDYLGDSWPALYIGEYNRRNSSSGTKFVTSSYKVSRHPNYSRITFSYDIAILTLNIPIPLDNYECLHPICLPEVNHVLKAGDMCTVAGWGSTSRTQYQPAVSSPSLMKTHIQVLEDSVCQDKFGIYFNGRSQICAGDLTGSTDSCVGDSGGPLMCSMTSSSDQPTKKMPVHVLMGVISSGGTPCAQADTPALYTDLQEMRYWMRSVLN